MRKEFFLPALLTLFFLITAGYRSPVVRPAPPPSAAAAKIILPLEVVHENGDLFNEQVSVVLCGWMSPVSQSVQAGVINLDITESAAHPIRIRLINDDFVPAETGMQGEEFCGCSGDPGYLIPPFAFDFEERSWGDWLGAMATNNCEIKLKPIRITMLPLVKVNEETEAIADNQTEVDDELFGPGSSGSGRGRGGPSPGDVSWEQDKDIDREYRRARIKEWAAEYARMDLKKMPRLFQKLFPLYRKGDYRTLLRYIERWNPEDRLVEAGTFQQRKEVEYLTELAARASILMGQPKLARRYYEVAVRASHYQVPVAREFSDYLVLRKELPVAEQVLQGAILSTRFRLDEAILHEDLNQVYVLNKQPEKADLSLQAAQIIRADLSQIYARNNVKNTKIIERNQQQMELIGTLRQTTDEERKEEIQSQIRLNNTQLINPRQYEILKVNPKLLQMERTNFQKLKIRN